MESRPHAQDPRTQPLRDEHIALLAELAMLRVAADAVGTPGGTDHVDRAHRLLVRHLLPHMAAEEAVLYPVIDELAGSHATATLRRDHDEIRRLTAQLPDGRAEPEGDRQLRAALYGLDSIVRLHLAKEEELFYPLLDQRLDGSAALALIAALHEVERDLYHGDASIDPTPTSLP